MTGLNLHWPIANNWSRSKKNTY